MSKIYGYARVSTEEQKIDRQIIALMDFGVSRDCIFVDKQSGKDFNRPSYKKLIKTLKAGDTLIIKSLDRLGRNYDEIIRQLDIITREKNTFIVVLDTPLIDTREKYGNDLTGKFIANLVIQLFSYVAQMEREMNHQRTIEGIAVAKAKGVRFGRPPMDKPINFEVVKKAWQTGKISAREAAKRLEVARATFVKWAKQ